MSNPLSSAVVVGLLEDNKDDWRVQTAANGIPYYYNIKVSLRYCPIRLIDKKIPMGKT